MKIFSQKLKKRTVFIQSFIAGLGWMAGATIGFALFITLLSFVLRLLGGLPFIGDFIANLIKATNKALEVKKRLP